MIPGSSDLGFWVSLSRYCIERVFRPRKLDRFHPKELLECAFDIVTSAANSSLPTAEVIYTICEIIQEFPALQVTFQGLMFRGYPARVLDLGRGGGCDHNRTAPRLGTSSRPHFARIMEKSLMTLLGGFCQALASALTGVGFVFICSGGRVLLHCPFFHSARN